MDAFAVSADEQQPSITGQTRPTLRCDGMLLRFARDAHGGVFSAVARASRPYARNAMRDRWAPCRARWRRDCYSRYSKPLPPWTAGASFIGAMRDPTAERRLYRTPWRARCRALEPSYVFLDKNLSVKVPTRAVFRHTEVLCRGVSDWMCLPLRMHRPRTIHAV